LFVTIVFLLSADTFCQQNPYVRVDSMMRDYKEKIKDQDDLYKLTYYIRRNFDSDSLRFRAAFIWITDNIDYDVKALKKDDPAAGKLEYAVKNKKAVCAGYASLVKYFCNSFSIDCEIITGYGRTGKRDIVMNRANLRSNHAWNSVKINGTWRLVDATWAAGSVDDTDEDNMVYYKGFNEIYYFTPPEKMVLNHLPVHKHYQFTVKGTDQKKFMSSPLFFSDFLEDSIQKVLPDTALIKTKKGDTLTFRFKINETSSRFFAFSDRLEKVSFEGDVTYKDGWTLFRYPVTVNGFYNLYIGYYLTSTKKKILLAYKIEAN